jgi:programmed cell death protein 5
MDPGMNIPSAEEMQMMEAQKAAQEERRIMILDQILEPAAKARMSTLALVKKEKARAVEDSLINAASSGRLKSKVTEEQLIAMLQQFSGGDDNEGAGGKKKGIVVQRRKTGFEDDDDDSDSDLA